MIHAICLTRYTISKAALFVNAAFINKGFTKRMNRSQTAEKRIKLIKQTSVCAAVLLGYYFFVRLTGLSIPCLFHEITGLKCPGCGITHMLMSAARLDFAAAVRYNCALFFMLPLLLALLAIKLVFMPKWLEKDSKAYNAIIICCVIILVLFGIIRNII